jgi:single-strand DNA-binding protein
MAKSLNKVQLIGNLTRDPEMRYTPQGTAVCTFGVATNRQWTTESGEKKDEADFHNIVSWNKLAEICAQLLKKGRKVYVEGRLSTRSWQAQDGTQRTRTEVVISDMIILDKREDFPEDTGIDIPEPPAEEIPEVQTEEKPAKGKAVKAKKNEKEEQEEDIPF